jgi:hypothetical protein
MFSSVLAIFERQSAVEMVVEHTVEEWKIGALFP